MSAGMDVFEVRLWGDPLVQTEAARALHAFLATAEVCDCRCALAMFGAKGEPEGVGRPVSLTDGQQPYQLYTHSSEAELAVAFRAAATAIPDSAPLIVFGDEDELNRAQFEFPCARIVRQGSDAEAQRLIEELRQEVQDLGTEPPAVALSRETYAPFLAFPEMTGQEGRLLHFAGSSHQSGTRFVLRAFAELDLPVTLRIHFAESASQRAEELTKLIAELGIQGIEFAEGPLLPEDFADVCAVVQPMREFVEWEPLLLSMAAGRPVIASRFGASAELFSEPGVSLPVGGRMARSKTGELDFVPDLRVLRDAIKQAVEDRSRAARVGVRARSHVVTRHVVERPLATAADARTTDKPLVVLEAPLFELSSSSLLTIETAKALHARGRVELRLVPRTPFQSGFDFLSGMAPELVSCLSRNPGRADLWLTAGWPPRPARPDTVHHAVRLDWEYGALPTELTPLVPMEADSVVVHSEVVRRVVSTSGRSNDSIELIPHGVDGTAFHEKATAMERVIEFKKGRRAILFVGGLIWRKGFDLVLKTLLEAFRGCETICLVIKPMGAKSSYRGYELGALLEKFMAMDGAIETLVIEDDLDSEELAGMYRACDLLFHPYRGEGFGLPVLEARACGLPILVTRGGSTDAFVQDGSCVTIPAERRGIDLRGSHEGSPFVLEPNPVEMARLLKECLVQLTFLRNYAEAQAPELRRVFSWSSAALRIERLAFAAQGEALLSKEPLCVPVSVS